MPRLESLLFDDIPAKEVSSVMNYGYVSGILQLQATALALCKAAHLSVLKRYVQRSLSCAFLSWSQGSGARRSVIQADEKAWQAINELCAHHDWELGHAVAEIIDVRMLLHVYLQPRLAANASLPHSAASWWWGQAPLYLWQGLWQGQHLRAALIQSCGPPSKAEGIGLSLSAWLPLPPV